MVRDVLLRLAERVRLLKAAPQQFDPQEPPVPGVHWAATDVEPDQIEEVVDRAAFDGQGAVHIGLTEHQPWIEGKSGMQGAIVKPDRHRRAARCVAVAARLALGVDDGQFTALDDGSEELRKQHFCPQPSVGSTSHLQPRFPG